MGCSGRRAGGLALVLLGACAPGGRIAVLGDDFSEPTPDGRWSGGDPAPGDMLPADPGASPVPADLDHDPWSGSDARAPADLDRRAPGDAFVPDPPAGLGACLTSPTCQRAFIFSHMGAWNQSVPANSMAAFAAALALGADGIEMDVRITADGHPVVIHDDTITFYQSTECLGRRISEMTVDEVRGCHLVPSATETIPVLADVVEWARGRIVLALDVKDGADIAPTVALLRASDAADVAFVMVSLGEVVDLLPAVPEASEVYYSVWVSNEEELGRALGELAAPERFMIDMDRAWDGLDQPAMESLLAQVHAQGKRVASSSNRYLPTTADHRHLFAMGFDAVLSYNTAMGVAARDAFHAAEGW